MWNTLANKNFQADLQASIHYSEVGKKYIDQSIYKLFRILGSYFAVEKNLPQDPRGMVDCFLFRN